MAFRMLAAHCRHDTTFDLNDAAHIPGTGADTANFNARTGCTDA